MTRLLGYSSILAVLIILGGIFLLPGRDEASMPLNASVASTAAPQASHAPADKQAINKQPAEIMLDVPLLKQMDAPRLYNGCEVTSLAMVLRYEGFDVTKNELASKIKRVQLKYGNGQFGNPNTGFVGDMENGPGLGVYNGPIFSLAKEMAGNRVENLTGKPFDAVLEKLAGGSPVWVIINTAYAPLGKNNFKTWATPEGPVEVTYNMHSVAITGYDEHSIFVNDPYGTKNRKLPKEAFIKGWEQMGSQAVAIN